MRTVTRVPIAANSKSDYGYTKYKGGLEIQTAFVLYRKSKTNRKIKILRRQLITKSGLNKSTGTRSRRAREGVFCAYLLLSAPLFPRAPLNASKGAKNRLKISVSFYANTL
jgi:hypothetical protein